ncbi:MAG TPA: hypothetical protein VJN71_11110 [Nitrososphaerales archaeon]|nr:hypothetical protein [Nitrososphaerales archaeon]
MSLSHIVSRDEKTGRYVAVSRDNARLKASADSLYDAVELLQIMESAKQDSATLF